MLGTRVATKKDIFAIFVRKQRGSLVYLWQKFFWYFSFTDNLFLQSHSKLSVDVRIIVGNYIFIKLHGEYSING